MLTGFSQVTPSIDRASKLLAAEVVAAAAPVLVLEAVPDTARVIDREPLFIAAFRRARC
jgi:hypothetical protein